MKLEKIKVAFLSYFVISSLFVCNLTGCGLTGKSRKNLLKQKKTILFMVMKRVKHTTKSPNFRSLPFGVVKPIPLLRRKEICI